MQSRLALARDRADTAGRSAQFRTQRFEARRVGQVSGIVGDLFDFDLIGGSRGSESGGEGKSGNGELEHWGE